MYKNGQDYQSPFEFYSLIVLHFTSSISYIHFIIHYYDYEHSQVNIYNKNLVISHYAFIID